MKIFVDIDGTICKSGGSSYVNAKPIPENIAKINRLYDEGNTIIYWTARGGTTGIDWSALTGQQLVDWGCKFHDLIMNQKPSYDLLICDKSKRIEEI
jgi:histidinol phosphatase-like enzyme